MPVHQSSRCRTISLALAALAGAVVLAGCGDDDDQSAATTPTTATAPTTPTTAGTPTATSTVGTGAPKSGSGGTTSPSGAPGGSASGAITVSLDAGQGGAIAFNARHLALPAGRVTIKMENASDAGTQHAVEIEGNGVEEASAVVGPGQSTSVTAQLDAGTYEFYCPVGNHKAQGMKGTLTIN